VRITVTRVKLLPAMLLACLLHHAQAADIVDTADKSSEIKTFSQALKSTEVGDLLKQNGPYTVFAPSNAAFDKLPPDTKQALLKDKKKLAQLLSHHVLAEKLLVAAVKPGTARTMHGDIVLKSDNGKVTVDEANVTLSDIEADNGVIHIIDTVLLPKE